VTENEYNSTGYTWDHDGLLIGLVGFYEQSFNLLTPSYWFGQDAPITTGLNVFPTCTDFATKASTYNIPIVASYSIIP
jgi:hypothetical protein